MEHLRGDRKSLASCSLVCSRWRDCAQELLFSGFTATISNTYRPEFHTRLTTLLEILEAHNSPGRYIRRLHISGPQDTDLHKLFSESMEKLLPHLRHIIELTLEHITWDLVSQEAKAQILSLSNLICLHWINVIFDGVDELVLFSGNFLKLERLSIGGVEVSRMDDSPSTFSQLRNNFAPLRYLHLRVRESTLPFLHALGSDIIRLQNIDTLELSIPILPGYIPPVIPLLKVTAPTLSTLKAVIPIPSPPHAHTQPTTTSTSPRSRLPSNPTKTAQVLAATDDVPLGSMIVLATGDGNVGQFSEDRFFGPVNAALKRGWAVELVAWGRSDFGGSRSGRGTGRFRVLGMQQIVGILVEEA
ncbi:hypothetical protein H0H92_002860 [Tricholoma furcatifolium]|nr:hypothetical protein H0H92_002860 [Tricholoma furcatifolium]